jgi:hypothetical protein
MSRVLLAVVLLFVSAPVRAAGIPPELEAEEDDITVIERTRRLLTRAVDKGDWVWGRELLAFLHRRIDRKRYVIFDEMEEPLLSALLGDFAFLERLKVPPAEPEEGLAFDGIWRDGLRGGLLARAEEARQNARQAPALGPADRDFADLYLFSVEGRGRRNDAGVLHRRGEAHLARYPDTPYRRYVLTNMVIRWRRGFAMYGRFYGSHAFLDDRTLALYRRREDPGMSFAIEAAFGEHYTLELHFSNIRMAPRQDLTIQGRTWPRDASVELTPWAVMAGYQLRRGRHAGALTVGLGGEEMRYDYGPGKDDHATFIPFAGAAGLEYKLEAYRTGTAELDRSKDVDWGLTFFARAAVERAFNTREGLSPLVWLVQLGMGVDFTFWKRRGLD